MNKEKISIVRGREERRNINIYVIGKPLKMYIIFYIWEVNI